jgi:hypothetical protein
MIPVIVVSMKKKGPYTLFFAEGQNVFTFGAVKNIFLCINMYTLWELWSYFWNTLYSCGGGVVSARIMQTLLHIHGA